MMSNTDMQSSENNSDESQLTSQQANGTFLQVEQKGSMSAITDSLSVTHDQFGKIALAAIFAVKDGKGHGTEPSLNRHKR